MAAELVQLELRRAGLSVGPAETIRLDRDNPESTEQLDRILVSSARAHGRGPVQEYSLRVLDQYGNRVLIDSFRTVG